MKSKPKMRALRPVIRPAKGTKPTNDAKPAPLSRDQLLDAICVELCNLDAAMDVRKLPRHDPGKHFVPGSISWAGSYSNDPIYRIMDKLKVHGLKLDTIERNGSMAHDHPGAAGAVAARFGTKLGEPVHWSRPGSLLLWLGDIPVRCEWGGFFARFETAYYALDPSKLFVNSQGTRGADAFQISDDLRTPREYFRLKLAQACAMDRYSPASGQLEQLDDEARVATAAFLAEPVNACWIEALAQPPVDPVALPDTLQPVQTKLFA